jgi:hypothetical protein
MLYTVEETIELAVKSGIDVKLKPNGHVQLKGDLMVNYYPESKKQTAYIAGTKTGKKHVSPLDAVAMCFKAPDIVHQWQRDKRKSGASRRQRAAMLKRGIKTCFWCSTPVTLDSSTVEHKIPLMRGGLDNANNRTLACLKCNNDRGHDMPELKGCEV